MQQALRYRICISHNKPVGYSTTVKSSHQEQALPASSAYQEDQTHPLRTTIVTSPSCWHGFSHHPNPSIIIWDGQAPTVTVPRRKLANTLVMWSDLLEVWCFEVPPIMAGVGLF